MLPPQSDEEVRAVEADLRRIDRFLYLAWNPRARVVRPGVFDAYGAPTLPAYDGRWEVRRKTDQGEDQLIWTVAWEAEEEFGKAFGDYRSVGPWLPRKMRLWDQANREAAEAYRARLWAEHDATERSLETIDEAGYRETLESFAARLDDQPLYWKGGLTS